MFHSSLIIATISPDAIKAIAIVIAVLFVMGWADLRSGRRD